MTAESTRVDIRKSGFILPMDGQWTETWNKTAVFLQSQETGQKMRIFLVLNKHFGPEMKYGRQLEKKTALGGWGRAIVICIQHKRYRTNTFDKGIFIYFAYTLGIIPK